MNLMLKYRNIDGSDAKLIQHAESKTRADIKRTYEKALGAKIDLFSNQIDKQFFDKVVEELKQKEQLIELLYDLNSNLLGVEEIVLLLIWSKPLVQPPGAKRDEIKND